MIGWMVFTAYIVGWALVGRAVAIHHIESDARLELRHRETMGPGYKSDVPLVDGELRMLAIMLGLFVGMAWPIALVCIGLARSTRAPSEKAYVDRVELEQLRKLAREHGLPMPGGES